ncbi:hypothetical protein GQ53DRAFT_845385 [Thozetella sp. PMI_491]|nr:hypothetical protein GQ53DRAFT_845385 [Thozetella sp. PMI_491]
MDLLSLNYRRPAYVQDPERRSSLSDSIESDSSEKSDVSLRSGSSGSSRGIPAALSFDKILDGGVCPPCTLRDFMNYLIYVERAAENLQFFLWYKDYSKRFYEADTIDLGLSKEWTAAMEEEAGTRIQKEHADQLRANGKKPSPAVEIFKDTGFDTHRDSLSPPKEIKDSFSTPPRSSTGDWESQYAVSNATSCKTQVNEAFFMAGAKAPFTIQPFRGEIDRIIATYIADGAPRQLNLSSREQKMVLQALSYTTHPSALRLIAQAAESTLRRQSHPNFIRWSICNGNPPRVFFARGLGVGLIIMATAAATVLTLSSASRGFRAIAAVGWVLGIATLIAAWKGMCVVLHGMHHRHVRPWELFETAEEGEERFTRSSDSFGSSNSFESEPWVVKYEKRNITRKVFDREIWIEEPALRQIQDTIFVQSMLCALLMAGILAAIFVVVPGGNLF